MLSNPYTKLLNHKLLDKQETYKLIKQYQEATDPVIKQQVLDTLIRSNFKLIYKLASNFCRKHNGVELDDCIQQVCLSLKRTTEKFNCDFGLSYSTYVYQWARSYLQRYYQTTNRTVRLPTHSQELLFKIKKYIKQEVLKNNGKRPTVLQIAEYLDTTPDKVQECLLSSRSIVSLNKNINTEGEITELLELLSDYSYTPDQSLENASITESINQLLDILSPKDKNIVSLYFGLDESKALSLQKIGDVHNCTRENIRQRLDKSLKQLRQHKDISQLKYYLS